MTVYMKEEYKASFALQDPALSVTAQSWLLFGICEFISELLPLCKVIKQYGETG